MHAPDTQEFTYETSESFELHTNAQDAVFYIAMDWTGGPAGIPVINIENRRPYEYEGTDIYVEDSESYDKIDAMVQEKSQYSSYVKVSANVTLVPDASGDVMLPPEGDSDEPAFESSGYAALYINELYDVLAVDKFGRKPSE